MRKFSRKNTAARASSALAQPCNDKDFTEHSDIDLVVFGLPKGKYFSISSEIGDLTTFEVDLIPAEGARPFTMQIVAEEGVEL